MKKLNPSGGELIFGIVAKEITKSKENITSTKLLPGIPLNIF